MLSDLEAAEQAFERGDYAEVRRRARAALSQARTDEEKERARELLASVSNDRAVFVLLAACVVFFVVIILTYALPRS